MAIVSIPLLGQASGKFSDSEFYRLGNKNILRSSKLKRYKKNNVVNSYYQLLLKKIVSSIMPLSFLLKLSYKPNSKHINYFNLFLSRNYHKFSLNENNYLFCDDLESIQFSTSVLSSHFTASVLDYSAYYIEFELQGTELFRDSAMMLIAILCTNNFRSTVFYNCMQPDINLPVYRIEYPEPPFNSADYHCFLMYNNTIDNSFYKSCYGFFFSH